MTGEEYMQLAIVQARKAEEIDEVPVGAVIVLGEEVIAAAHNERETTQNPLAHAEITAIRQAAQKLKSWRLLDCTLYVTLEPCPMCAGAIVNARIPRVVFGAYDPKAGAFGTLYNLAEGKLNHTPEVLGGVLGEECGAILTQYFRNRRSKK
ncbi:MAG: tRNA adenosine(34) deaminase TadA [Christensenellaceae bacterium]